MFQNFSRKKLLVSFLLFLLAAFGVGRLYYQLTDDFRLANISSPLPLRPEWEVAPLSSPDQKKIDSILDQPFTYIGKGVQSYAFVSADDLYVLKFFKFKHLKDPFFMKWLPAWGPFEKYRQEKIHRKVGKFDAVFGGYHLAYTLHRQESGLLFIHLNLTQQSLPTVTLTDKLGRKLKVNLDQVPFLIQVKAQTMRTVLHNLLVDGNIQLAKTRITEILDLYYAEYQKGLYDHDHGIMHNAGFAGDSPIHLDVGKLKYDEEMRELSNYSQDIVLVARRMAKWLKVKEPRDYPELAKHIEEKISTIIQEPFHL